MRFTSEVVSGAVDASLVQVRFNDQTHQAELRGATLEAELARELLDGRNYKPMVREEMIACQGGTRFWLTIHGSSGRVLGLTIRPSSVVVTVQEPIGLFKGLYGQLVDLVDEISWVEIDLTEVLLKLRKANPADPAGTKTAPG